MALGFRDSDALRVVMSSGLPAELVGGAARVARGADGRVVLAPEPPLDDAMVRQLRALGVALDAELPPGARTVRCWAEAIGLERVRVDAPPLVLLVTERADALVELAAELLRLGCDRQELLASDGVAAIRAVDAPTYSVMRALDHEAGLCAYTPDATGTVWTELGYRHALADRLRAEPGTLLLIGSERWRTLPDAGWRWLDAALELAVPGDGVVLAPAALPVRRIELRLSVGRRAAASLWVVRRGGVAAIDQLLARVPDEIVEQLTFAATGGDEPVVIVRARPGRHAPPELALTAEAYAPLADMPDVYAPADALVEPPLRRERLRAILGASESDIAWLAPLADRRFRVERIADGAFLPLAEWAEYVLHASARALVPWMRATELEFAPVVAPEPRWPSAPPAVEATIAELRQRRRSTRRLRRPRPLTAAPSSLPAEVIAPASAAPPIAAVLIDRELAALEAAFVALDAPGDAPGRIALFEQLASAYARLGRRRDAALCAVRAAWEAPAVDAPARLDAWLARDGGLAGRPAAVLAQTAPDPDDVRALAGLAAADGLRGVADRLGDWHRVQRWLDEHDAALDVRTLWLARSGLARLAGGDPLALAHARDRILVRLAGGLPVEHELPGFLQLAGRTGAFGHASGERLAGALDELAQRIATSRRRRSLTEAPPALTGAYIDFLLAHGYARIARHDRARALVGRARGALAAVAGDPVHGYLIAAFGARIDQAIAGAAPEMPLGDEIARFAGLAGMDRLARFKVDRLREASRILEPVCRLDAFGAYLDGRRGGPLAEFRATADPAARTAAMAQLLDAAASAGDDERPLGPVLDALLELPASEAVAVLADAWPHIARVAEPRRALLYAKALVVAGHLDHGDLVRELLTRLGGAIHAAAPIDLERVVQHSVRALRRIGLRGELAELLAGAEHALAASGADAFYGRLALAAGLASLGDVVHALPVFEQAHAALAGSLLLAARLELIRALGLAYAQAPLDVALAGIARLADQLRDVTDSLATNSHFCLSVLHVVESFVLGLTSDDVSLGEPGRRFIDDDEHLVRRRLHRDLGGAA